MTPPPPVFDPMDPKSLEEFLAGLDPKMFENFQLPPEQMGGIGSFIDQALQQHQQQVQDAQQAAFHEQGFLTTPVPAKFNRYEDPRDMGGHDPFDTE
jgi:hypothetical protein